MHWIWEGLIGLLAGAVAKFIMPGKDPGGIIITMRAINCCRNGTPRYLVAWVAGNKTRKDKICRGR